MKKILTLTLVCLTTVAALAQNPLKKGQKQLNAGVGISGLGVPVYVGMEFGVHEDISVAGDISYQSDGDSFAKTSAIGVSLKGNYHFNRILKIEEKFDFYAGVGLNYYNFNTKIKGSNINFNSPYDSGIGFDLQIGGRYFFSNNFGVNLELGGGNILSGGKLGITYKF